MKRILRTPAAGMRRRWSKGLGRSVGASFERFCLTAGIATLGHRWRRTPSGCAGRAMAAPRLGGPPLGEDQGKGRLPRRQGRDRAAARAWPCRRRGSLAELGGGAGRGSARAMGAEPDADQRLDAQVRPRGSPARRRRSRRAGRRRLEIGGLAPVRRAVGGAHGRMDGGRPVAARLARHPDRWPAHRGRTHPGGRRRGRRRQATSIRSAWSKGPPRTPPRSRHCWTT